MTNIWQLWVSLLIFSSNKTASLWFACVKTYLELAKLAADTYDVSEAPLYGFRVGMSLGQHSKCHATVVFSSKRQHCVLPPFYSTVFSSNTDRKTVPEIFIQKGKASEIFLATKRRLSNHRPEWEATYYASLGTDNNILFCMNLWTRHL